MGCSPGDWSEDQYPILNGRMLLESANLGEATQYLVGLTAQVYPTLAPHRSTWIRHARDVSIDHLQHAGVLQDGTGTALYQQMRAMRDETFARI